MKIKILSDSTCDLTKQILEANDISVIPLTVIKNDEQFKDGVTITPDDIFAHVAAGGDLCSTTAINVGEFDDFFAQFEDDYDGLIMITIGSGFSSCYQNACLAAEDHPKVRVIDSMNLTTGQGLVALEACRLAKDATDLDALADQIRQFTGRIEASFLLEQLKYMVKGGRCSSAAALGANLLNLKPCIEVKDGKMSVVKKYRGNYAKCLASYVKDRLADRENLDSRTLFITHTIVDDDCMKAVTEAVEQYGNFENVYDTPAGCTVSCHCGPGTLGIIFVRK